MELRTGKIVRPNLRNKIPDNGAKQCFQEYKLQDGVDALKNYLGIKDGFHRDFRNDENFATIRSKKLDVVGVKECLQPYVPSVFQIVANELRDTVKNSYWNKEVGKTIYLPPYLPAGCDPVATTFGKATVRGGYGVAEILKPRDDATADAKERVHALYRRSHNDYDPSEQIDRKYEPPFDRCSSFGGETKKKMDRSGKKLAECIRWCNAEPLTLVNRRLAEYRNRTVSRVGKVKNGGTVISSENVAFEKNDDDEFTSVANTLNESVASQRALDDYCTEYAEKISKSCETRTSEKIPADGISIDGRKPSRSVAPKSGLRCDNENLGDQTSVHALVSPNIFTQMGLSHVDFFKVRDYDEIRSIYENIGIRFTGDDFDVLWKEGLAKDRTGGVCIETFRNLLPIDVLENLNDDCNRDTS